MVKEYILELLQKNYDIQGDIDIDNLNFVEEGFISSLGIIQFIIDIEEKYNIRFTEEELASEQIRIVGSLVKLIEYKMEQL